MAVSFCLCGGCPFELAVAVILVILQRETVTWLSVQRMDLCKDFPYFELVVLLAYETLFSSVELFWICVELPFPVTKYLAEAMLERDFPLLFEFRRLPLLLNFYTDVGFS